MFITFWCVYSDISELMAVNYPDLKTLHISIVFELRDLLTIFPILFHSYIAAVVGESAGIRGDCSITLLTAILCKSLDFI